MNSLTRTCLSGSSLIFLSLLGIRVGPSLFGIPFVKPFLLCEPNFLQVCLGFGLWASNGPFPLSAHFGLYKRRRDPPPNPSRHLTKKGVSSISSGCSRKAGEGVQLPPPPHASVPPSPLRRSSPLVAPAMGSSPLSPPTLPSSKPLPPPPLCRRCCRRPCASTAAASRLPQRHLL